MGAAIGSAGSGFEVGTQAAGYVLFVAVRDDGVDHRVAPLPLRRFGKPGIDEHLRVVGQAGVGRELLPRGGSRDVGVGGQAEGDVGDERRRGAAGRGGALTQGGKRGVADVLQRADPGDGAVGNLAAEVEGPLAQRGRHHRHAAGQRRRQPPVGVVMAAVELDRAGVEDRLEHGDVLAQVAQRRLEVEAVHRFRRRLVARPGARRKRPGARAAITLVCCASTSGCRGRIGTIQVPSRMRLV